MTLISNIKFEVRYGSISKDMLEGLRQGNHKFESSLEYIRVLGQPEIQ